MGPPGAVLGRELPAPAEMPAVSRRGRGTEKAQGPGLCWDPSLCFCPRSLLGSAAPGGRPQAWCRLSETPGPLWGAAWTPAAHVLTTLPEVGRPRSQRPRFCPRWLSTGGSETQQVRRPPQGPYPGSRGHHPGAQTLDTGSTVGAGNSHAADTPGWAPSTACSMEGGRIPGGVTEGGPQVALRRAQC